MEPSSYGMTYTGDQPLRVHANDDSFERIQSHVSKEEITVRKNKASEDNITCFYHRLPPVKVVDDSFDRIQSHVSKEEDDYLVMEPSSYGMIYTGDQPLRVHANDDSFERIQRNISQKEVTVRKDKASEVHIKSFDHRLPPVKVVDDSFDRIQSHVFKEDTLALYPTVAEKHHLARLLKLRLAATHTAGLAYIAKNLAISNNMVAKPKPDNVLFDICLITQTKPTVILSVVKDPNEDLTASRRYNLSLAKAVTDTIRRFTDEQFCSMYGLINESTLADQSSFDEALLKIKDEVSRICVPDSLSMSMQKYEKVGRAFLMSLAVTRFVTDETGEISTALWLLTFDQFCFLTENIDRNEVHVSAKYHSGVHVLMREVASRLEKGAPTLLLHSSNENVELARRMSVCSYMCDLDEFQQDRNKQIHVPLNVDNIVTDCTQMDIAPLMTHNPNIWYFEDEETDSLKQEVTRNLMGLKGELDVHKMSIFTTGVLSVVAIIGGLILAAVTEKASLTDTVVCIVGGVVSKLFRCEKIKDTDLNGKKQKVEQEAVRPINASYSSCTYMTSLDGESDGFCAAATGVTTKLDLLLPDQTDLNITLQH